MRTALSLLAVLLAVGVGMRVYPHSLLNALLAGAVIYLAIEVVALRRRIERLERTTTAIARDDHPEATHGTPLVRDPGEPTADKSFSRQAAAAEEHPRAAPEGKPPPPSPDQVPVRGLLAGLTAPVVTFFTSGNPVLKIGLVVLFFGVAFLLKYAAQRTLIPIELRLAGVALGGLILLAAGWRLRHSRRNYGLGLEGGGIGVLYLVVFAAAKLYHLLPLPLALTVMISLVGLSCALAVLQEARGLAVSGSIGGFLAPVLMSTDSGSHVLLFSYYALLNSSILGIAWFKAWRELNLIGFTFTFAIATLWGASAYTPDHFATTEPFLILFFLMYCLIAVLFAHRQPLRLRGFIDGPLVFGLPIVASGLQAYLVHDFRYGMALSALMLGGWYVGLSWLLWRQLAEGMRLLTEAFLALGVIFASLAIPLGLDPNWTAAAWALEGAAMVWVGSRQDRPLARLFGLLLQIGAAVSFVDGLVLPANSGLLVNWAFLGSALLASAALFSSFWLDRYRDQASPWELPLPPLLLAWGLSWWYGGGYRDLDHHLEGQTLPPAFLLYAGLTTLCLGGLAHRFSWQRMVTGLLVLLPIMLFTLIAQVMGWNAGSLLAGCGWLAWPLAFTVLYGLLARFEEQLPPRSLPWGHSLGLWLLMAVLAIELAWRVDRMAGIAEVWSLACWGGVPMVVLFALEFHGDRLTWPVARCAATYHGIATDVPLLALLLWTLASFTASGDPDPLPFLPLLNPLELVELAILLLALLRTLRPTTSSLFGERGLIATAALLFIWLNVAVGRCVHWYAHVPYRFDALFSSPILQAAVAALWSVLALTLTILGARKAYRRVWLTGAGLLCLTVIKLFVIDLSGTGTIGRIVSFLVVGLLMLIIGFFAPLPPKPEELPR